MVGPPQFGIEAMARARFKYGNALPGVAQFAADIPVGFAGGRGAFTAFPLQADIPASLRMGALEALVGQLDLSCNDLMLGKMGIDVP